LRAFFIGLGVATTCSSAELVIDDAATQEALSKTHDSNTIGYNYDSLIA